MKSLLFIGGTSFFGRRAVELLVQSGQYHVTLLTRGNRACPAGAAPIRCDRNNLPELRNALRGKSFDVVVDNIALNARDIQGVLDALQRRVGHFLFCSSAAVYPDCHTPHAWIEAEAALRPIPGQPPFANGKREAERHLIEAGGVPYTIYRPTVVEGPDDPVDRTRYFVEKIHRQEQLLLPDDVVLQHVYADDVAAALVKLIAAGPTHRAYNISGDDRLSIATYCDQIAALLHKPACHAVVSRQQFLATRDNQFPILYDHSLLLANALIRKTVPLEFTAIQRWLPVTIAWLRGAGVASARHAPGQAPARIRESSS